MTQLTVESGPSHVFANYTVEPVPLFAAPDAVSHGRMVEALTEVIETGQGTLAPEMGGNITGTATNSLTNSGTNGGTGTITADSDTSPDMDSDGDADSDGTSDS